MMAAGYFILAALVIAVALAAAESAGG